ncbi:MAG TPA: DinB family protein [Ktedonobacterales bacterium]|nr:DinB family protein [Ktedonobacterales bacterium]
MADSMASGLDFYQGWERYQDLLIQAISDLTPEQLNYRTADHLRSIGETVRHIIGARARWLHFVLGFDGPALVELGRWDRDDMPERTSQELTEGLRSSWAVLRDALAGWTSADLAVMVPNVDPDPGEPEEFTRQWVIWHLIEHDLHHGGEITQTLGTQGLSGADI